MKILYVIDKINIGGATDALFFLMQNCDTSPTKIVCRENLLLNNSYSDISINTGDGNMVFNTFIIGDYDIIHWFKAESSIIFDELCTKMKNESRILPIITTVCQYPRYFKLRLTPNEIKFSQNIVFIDNHAFFCKYNKVISNDRKSMIYFGLYIEKDQLFNILNEKNKRNNNYVIYGRGSSINKCHKHMIRWFYDIKIINKFFIIVGIGEITKWLKSDIHKYALNSRIEIHPHLSSNEWLEKLNTFDIFLYQIPKNSYSSIDGTIQAAMLLKKPVVYYGSEPPKELIVHGESGFIANNKKEFIHYASMLANDSELRRKIGLSAHERIYNSFNWKSTVDNYNKLYNLILEKEPTVGYLSKSHESYYYISSILLLIRVKFFNLFPVNLKRSIKTRISVFLGK